MAGPHRGSDARRHWVDALTVVTVIVVVILTARQLRPFIEAGAFVVRTGDFLVTVTATSWVRAGLWIGIAAALLYGWYCAAAIGAWLAVGFEAVYTATALWGDPRYRVAFDLAAWPLLLAAAAAAGITVLAIRRGGLELFTRPGWITLSVAAAVTSLSAAVPPLLGEDYGSPDDGFGDLFAISTQVDDTIAVLTRAAVLLLALAVPLGVHRGVRGRVYTLLLAGIAAALAIQIGLPLPLGTSSLRPADRLSEAVALVLGPVLVLAIGVTLNRRRHQSVR
jgi:hypothetical protein